MTVGPKKHTVISGVQRAFTLLLCVVLTTGTIPVAWANQASDTSSDTANNENTNTNNTENENTNKNENSTPQPDPQPDPQPTPQPSPQTPAADNSNSSASSEQQEDPYAYSYSPSNANAGSNSGSVTWISANSPQESSILQARQTFTSSSSAILVSTEGGAEVLCAAALAGACNAPLLFVDEQAGLDEAEMTLLHDLGVTKVYAIGIASSISAESAGDIPFVRLGGSTPAETSLEVLRLGVTEHLWNPVMITLANGDDESATNVSAALVYKQAQPVLLTDDDGNLTNSEKMFLSNKGTDLSGLAGIQTIALDGSVQQRSIDALSLYCCENTGCINIEKIEGGDACELSQNVDIALFDAWPDWTKSVVVNPDQVTSATAGIMALRQGGAAVATWYDSLSPWAQNMANSGQSVLRFSGEGDVVSSAVSLKMRAAMGIYTVKTYGAGISIVDMAKKEVERYIEDGKATRSMDEVLESMDPGLASRGSEYYYLFAKLGDGYSGVVSADQLNDFIDSVAGTYEASYGGTSVLRGQGQAFIDAAKENGINEVYLLAHAILESACGCSSLARGNAGGMNMFGIGAFDSDPNNGGSYASSQGWNSAEASVKGGGAWIAGHYIHSEYGQDTLYQMRWNVSSGVHQYATSLTWAKSISKLMNRFYEHANISLDHTGLNFKVIVY